MSDKLCEILKVIESLNVEDLKKVNVWVGFVLDKKENPGNNVFVNNVKTSP